jgi:predicted Rossmann fold flavoprotein
VKYPHSEDKMHLCNLMENKKKLVVIGGGAAGFFGAITAAENNPELDVIILEQGAEVLGKVKISGGGRCNVTHACFDVKELVKFYPRGSKELIGPFSRFNCSHTIQWFENRGVELKTEEDGRMFPVTNHSQTIIDCLIDTATELDIKIIRRAKVMQIESGDEFRVRFNDGRLHADYLLIAPGSNPTIWNQLKNIGHTITAPVPSLFTFNIKSEIIKCLEGISVDGCEVSIEGSKTKSQGPVLITHWGLSGPAILKLSAFAAVEFAGMDYKFRIIINWIQQSTKEAIETLMDIKSAQAKKNAGNYAPFELPNRFWKSILSFLKIDETKKYADISKEEINKIAGALTACTFEVNGKSTNKDEFVTAGGVDLKEVDFKTMESKIMPGLYLAGEVLNIDGVTGGFNFQSAWTTGFIAGSSIGDVSNSL